MVVMQLYLCEKPSQAKDIAAVLGAKRRGDGCWLGTGVTVTWCIGHLLETAPPDAYDARYKRWVLADLPIIPDKWNDRPSRVCQSVQSGQAPARRGSERSSPPTRP